MAGRLVRLACERHLRDLKDGAARGLHFDVEAANRAIGFFPDVLRLAEGEHAGKPFVLQPFQQFKTGVLFGWKTEDGFRRFRTAYIEEAKGQGKSPWLGGIGLYMMMADGEASAECYIAATTRDQANISFQDAVKMVEASPALSGRILKSGSRHVYNLAHMASGSYFRPVSSEGRGLDGKRVHFAGLDEVHEHPTAIVVDKMSAGTKGRRQPLIAETTNSGFGRHSVCWNHRQYSEKVLEGTVQDDSWFAYICCLDEGDDWKDPKVWIKTNPNLGISVTHKYLEEQVKQAIGIASKENIVKRLNFCIWTEQSTRWIPIERWDQCVEKDDKGCIVPVDEAKLRGRPCWGGLDLSRTTDLSSLVLAFPPEEQGGQTQLICRVWVPQASIQIRSHRDKVPYSDWEKQGLLVATPGEVVDYDFIRNEIVKLAGEFDIREIAYDRTFAGELVNDLTNEAILMVEHGQGFLQMAQPTANFEKKVIGRQYNHGGHQIMRWAMANCAVQTDAAGNIKPDKAKSTERIDPIVAAIMGDGRATGNPGDAGCAYDTRGVITI